MQPKRKPKIRWGAVLTLAAAVATPIATMYKDAAGWVGVAATVTLAVIQGFQKPVVRKEDERSP